MSIYCWFFTYDIYRELSDEVQSFGRRFQIMAVAFSHSVSVLTS